MNKSCSLVYFHSIKHHLDNKTDFLSSDVRRIATVQIRSKRCQSIIPGCRAAFTIPCFRFDIRPPIRCSDMIYGA